MNSRASCAFLERSGFAPGDRLAVVLIHRTSRRVVQRILAVEKAMAAGFQRWLREMNADRQFEIYASVNSIRADSVQRTKHDIAAIRHLFLDFDTDAQARVRELLTRSDLPRPTAVINSSRNHWQVLWQVTAFLPSRAEALQRGLARQAGADIAATDCSRVLRLPGFLNHKYSPPWQVSMQHFTPQTALTPADFPAALFLDQTQPVVLPDASRSVAKPRIAAGALSQSERDWAYAKRSLALGRPQQDVIAAIASNRTDKHNPLYYARLTVQKAAQAVANDPRSAKYLGGKS